MKIKMSVAAAFYDSLTGKKIPTGLLQIKTDEEISYVIKEGYFCFLNCSGSKLEISISAKDYQPKKQVFELTDSMYSYHVWMLPAKSYPFPRKPTVLEGQGLKPNMEIKLILKPKKARMRLKVSLSKNSKTIEIISVEHMEKAGRNYVLFSKDEKKEWINLTEEVQENVYTLQNPVQNSFEEDSSIYSVYQIMTDESGGFYLPLLEITEDCETVLIKDDKEEINFTLQKGGRYVGGEKVFLEGFSG